MDATGPVPVRLPKNRIPVEEMIQSLRPAAGGCRGGVRPCPVRPRRSLIHARSGFDSSAAPGDLQCSRSPGAAVCSGGAKLRLRDSRGESLSQPITLGLVIETKDLWEEVQVCLKDLPVRILLEQAQIGDCVALLEKLERVRPDVLLVDLTPFRSNTRRSSPG